MLKSSPVKKFVLCFLWLLSFLAINPFTSKSQSLTSSPYSRYGIGDIQFTGFAHQNGMGGVGIALDSSYHINTLNPASYSSIQLSTFEAGAFANRTQFSSIKASQTVTTGSLAYLAFGFPLTKWWGASFGLLPYSSVGYLVNDTTNIQNIGDINFSYQGSGGINQAYVGNGFKFRNLSAGFNAGYLFGVITQTRRVRYPDAVNTFNVRDINQVTVNDFSFNYGLQYKFRIDSVRTKNPARTDSTTLTQPLYIKKDITDLKFTFGFRFDLGSSVNARNTTLTQTFATVNDVDQFRDTVRFSEDEPGEINLPASYGVGFTFDKGDRFKFSADYTIQDWSQFNSFGKSDSLANSWKAAAGVQFIPDNTVNNFFKQTHYRLGFYYTDSYLQLKNSQLQEYAATLGFGFPLKKTRSTINLSLAAGKRGTIENNLIEEKFLKATIGFTLNDKWFVRRKID